jgi:hypothetical protein
MCLKRQGVSLSAATLGTVLATQSVSAAPAGLAATIAGTALAGLAANGTALTLLKTITMTMTKLKVGVLGGFVLVYGLAVGLFSQHQKLLQLQAENQALGRHTSALSQRMEGNTNTAGLPATAEEMDRLRRENQDLLRGNQELLRLRGEVGRLRREQAEAQGPLQDASTAATNAIQAMIMPDLASAANTLAFLGNGFYPTNFDEVKAKLAAAILHDRGLTNAEALGLERFEFVPYEKPLTTNDYGKLLLRERFPRRRVTDGKWVRLYTHVGSVTSEAISEDGNFDEFERDANIRRLGAGR